MRKEIWSSGGGEETAGDSGGWRRLLDGSAPEKASTCDFDEIFGFDPEVLQAMKKTRHSRAVRSCVFRELRV